MIRVERDQLDDFGQQIAPDAEWFQKAKDATEKAIESVGKGSIVFDRDIYAATIVRGALGKIFHDKCGYCEYSLARTDSNVEHYRPKSRVSQAPHHPGYYWLAYEWSNLLAACTYCNQLRRDPPGWQVAGGTRASGKADSFPLLDEEKRAQSPSDDISLEVPLLLNPTVDEPSEHMTFDPLGYPVAKSDMGESSISIYHLNSRRLNKDRQRVIARVTDLLRCRKRALVDINSPELDARLAFIDERLRVESEDAAPYAGAARAVMANPSYFGV